ncbi:MAG: MarR family winged helix-turn-helix transcriptional regulator [Gemmatimonadota bacterium]
MATCFRFLRVAGDVLAMSDACLSQVGLSHNRFTILFLLCRADDAGLTPSELADRLGVPRATMTGLLDGLERDGLIQRVRTASDRRSVMIRLTSRGRAFVDRDVPVHCERMSALMNVLDESERKALDAILTKLEAAVGEMK